MDRCAVQDPLLMATPENITQLVFLQVTPSYTLIIAGAVPLHTQNKIGIRQLESGMDMTLSQ